MVLSFSPVKKSAFYHQQLTVGAHMVERDGWLLPAYYSGAEQESRLLTENAGVFDVSPTGKLLLQGNGLDDLQRDSIQSGNALAVGEVRQVAQPACGRLARLTDDECVLLCEPAEIPEWTLLLSEVLDGTGHLVDQTSGMAGIRLTGPRSSDLLCKFSEFDTSPDSFPNLSCAQARFAEIHGTLVRTDIGPLPSYDLFFSREFGEYMWEAISEAGEEFGVGPVGLEAADRLQAHFATGPAVTTT